MDMIKTILEDFILPHMPSSAIPRLAYHTSKDTGDGFWLKRNGEWFHCRDKDSASMLWPWYEVAVQKAIDLLKPGELFIDAGANMGIHCIRAARRGAHVFAFEPDPTNFRYLQENTMHYPKVVCLPLAAWSHACTLTLHTVSNFSATSFVTPEAGDTSAIAIDDLNLKPRLMLVDCEGNDTKVLEGARQTLCASHPMVIFEGWTPAYAKPSKDLLRECGYEKIIRVGRWNYFAA